MDKNVLAMTLALGTLTGVCAWAAIYRSPWFLIGAAICGLPFILSVYVLLTKDE